MREVVFPWPLRVELLSCGLFGFSFGCLCPGCGPMYYFACPGLWVFFNWLLCGLCPACGRLVLFYQVVFVSFCGPSSNVLRELLSKSYYITLNTKHILKLVFFFLDN